MPSNYVLLRKITLTANSASVTFSSIPQTGYTDLKLVCAVKVNRDFTSDDLRITINSNTGATYGNRRLYGTGTNANTDGGDAVGLTYAYTGVAPAATATANTFSNTEFYFPSYTSSTRKSYTAESVAANNNSANALHTNANICSDTNPISIITIDGYNTPRDVLAGSTFSLYGLAAVGTTPEIAPFASGGDSVTNDGTYWIHTFLSSGTFTPTKALNCDYLVVAGGGGGGAQVGGGGGAGGYRTSIGGSTLAVTAQNYLVQVGAGGVAGVGGAADTNSKGTNGTNSVFSSISSTGGGAGGSYFAGSSGNSGGSGGGGTYGGGTGTGGAGNAGGYSPVEGFAGGFIPSSVAGAAGGGGGASAAGSNSSSGTGGAGGAGTANSISGSSVTYAGGGGGANAAEVTSAGGAGGGGNGGGGSSTNSTAGTKNTGGGGGGNRDSNTGTGSAGGSGIVIIRYPIA
jgi:hypothetical protein